MFTVNRPMILEEEHWERRFHQPWRKEQTDMPYSDSDFHQMYMQAQGRMYRGGSYPEPSVVFIDGMNRLEDCITEPKINDTYNIF